MRRRDPGEAMTPSLNRFNGTTSAAASVGVSEGELTNFSVVVGHEVPLPACQGRPAACLPRAASWRSLGYRETDTLTLRGCLPPTAGFATRWEPPPGETGLTGCRGASVADRVVPKQIGAGGLAFFRFAAEDGDDVIDRDDEQLVVVF